MTTDSISNSDSYTELTGSSNGVTTDEARDRLKNTLFSALGSEENTVIDAPTSLGKSHLLATTAWRQYPEITGSGLVIHIHQTRDARDEAVRRSEETDGVSHHLLEGREDACPVARGDYDDQINALQGFRPSEWLDHMCDVRGFGFGSAHNKLDNKRYLPCTSDGHCPSFKQWWKDLQDDGEPQVDVVHMTANFAYVEELIDGANVVFDERPDYSLSLDTTQREQIRDSISNLLQYRSDGEYSVSDILSTNTTADQKSAISELLTEEISRDWYFEYDETHRLAREISLAMLNAEEMFSHELQGENGEKEFSCRRIGEYDGVEVVLDGKDKIRHIHRRPDLSAARCIIGLDAFPTVYRWRLNTIDGLQCEEVLSSEERRIWRRNERGLKIVQLGEDTRSYTTGWGDGAGEERAKAVIYALKEKYGNDFRTSITSKAVKGDVRQQMKAAGIENPKMMHYGAQNSRNDFESETVGLLVGCIDPGDKNILDLLALGGKKAWPEYIQTEGGELTRATGRPFLGSDADIATELLESVRESNIAQAAGRYARKPDSDHSSATVYVWSDACPDPHTDDVISVSYHSLTDKRQEMIRLLHNGCHTARGLQEATGLNKSSIIYCLDQFHRQGFVDKSEGAAKYGATEWKCNEELCNIPDVIANVSL